MRIPILATLALLAGCANIPELEVAKMDSDGIAAATKVVSSKFDGRMTIQGPLMQVNHKTRPDDYLSDIDFRRIALRAFREKGETLHQVYVEIEYVASRWRFYETVSFVGGRAAKLLPIDRKVASCSARCNYVETLGVDVTDADLRGSGDLEFRLNSKSGVRDVVVVPRSYINGYLAAVSAKAD